MNTLESDNQNSVEASAGESIQNYAKRLIEAANQEGASITGSFNGVDLVVDSNQNLTPEDLVSLYLRVRDYSLLVMKSRY